MILIDNDNNSDNDNYNDNDSDNGNFTSYVSYSLCDVEQHWA